MARARYQLPMDISDLTFTPSELKFLGEYCSNGFDHLEAYKKAYPFNAKRMEGNELRIEGMSLANTREMKLAIQRFVSSVVDPYRDTMEAELLTILRARAMYDPAKYIDESGEAKSLDKIDRVDRYAIDGYKKSYYGRNGEIVVKEISLANRSQAIKQLQDLLQKGITEDKSDIPDDSRKRIRDIFEGLDRGVKLAQDLQMIQKKEEHQVEYTETEYIDLDTSLSEVVDTVEISPIVKKAKELAAKDSGGLIVENNPLVKRAREIARQGKL